MRRHLLSLAAGSLFTVVLSHPAAGQALPRVPSIPAMPALPVVPTPIPIAPKSIPVIPAPVPLPVPITPIRVPITPHPMPQPLNPRPVPQPLSMDPMRNSPVPPTTTAPTVDLRGTLDSAGGAAPAANTTSSDSDHSADTYGAVTHAVTTYTDPALEVREAQDRGVALHPGGQPPAKDKDDDDDDGEGMPWWLWLLIVVGVLVAGSWLRRGK
jgi:hypothetical protein